MADPVESLFESLSEISRRLSAEAEPSLETSLDDIHRKALLLAAASFFEALLSRHVEAYCEARAGAGSPLVGLVRAKAISRQYHTWFQWDMKNANSFFSLFGSGFRKYMEAIVAEDTDLADSIKEFLALGLDRNRLVHQNFGAFVLEATPEEVISRYRKARLFVDQFGARLDAFPVNEVAPEGKAGEAR